MRKLIPCIAVGLFLLAVVTAGCKHEPMPVPVDDSTQGPPVTDPENPGFKNDILPIFLTYCSGCHNAATPNEGYIFTSYETITAKKFTPGDPEDTELYEKITEEDDDDRMPQAPNPRLPEDKIRLIRNWILKGAPNN